MTKSKAFPLLETSRTENSSSLIRWLIILASIGLVSSLAIGLLLKRQTAKAQSADCGSSIQMVAIAGQTTRI
ncbi:hypothetical protein H6F67_24605 [Microcoleus sp. FACHB-1515]|uniref:hypothetical protein n=1 Tax=Cyanophyceae TaxID=3028117 RepID=UPI0016874BCC|nr:hypothetical protein [Microcoleus sp. FACHB-1515]MBD2093033.1 hypothetical protein [Microcoleus sp. FACHB-1515]